LNLSVAYWVISMLSLIHDIPLGTKSNQIGTKTVFSVVKMPHMESLSGLHNPAWWTGIRIAGLDSSYRVRLVTSNNVLFFELPVSEWTQGDREWVYFPWAIPAMMATTMGLFVEVRALDPSPRPLTIVLGFHELPLLPVHDRYIFVTNDGAALAHWDGVSHRFGCKNIHIGYEPAYCCLHRVVPPTPYLLATQAWDDNKLFCIHAWAEIVNMA